MNGRRALEATSDFVTPIAVVDVEVMQRNIARMADVAKGAGVRLRPHAKTHKMAEVAKRQIEGGAVGLTAATLHEAEVFADAGVDDLLLAHPPVGKPKVERLGRLAGRVSRLAVSVDGLQVAKSVPDSVDIYWEVDSGQHRIGTLPGEPTLRAVMDLVRQVGPKRFRGLITHAGFAYNARDQRERKDAAVRESQSVVETATLLRDEGVEVKELSVGSTPTADFAGVVGGITEMRPGTYVFGDANQVTLGSQLFEDCAFAVVATVVSTPTGDRAVLDCGSKALSADLRVAGLDSYGIVLDLEKLKIERLSEEHAVVTAEGETGLAVGDRVAVIPTHVCTTVNLHPKVLFVDQSSSEWVPVDARGWQ